MTCPWCGCAASPRELHAHLAESHPEAVATTEKLDKTFYEVTCPICGARYSHHVKKGSGHPEFIVEFGAEIRMVAFDMLVNHLMAEHTLEETGA